MKNQKYDGYDKVIRELINQETNLINSRMNWLILVEGLLFAGFSQLYDKNILYSLILSFVGLSVSLGMKYSFWSSEKATAFILEKWNGYIKSNQFSYDDFPPVWAGAGWKLSKREKQLVKYRHFLGSHKLLPYIFMFGWISIIVTTIIIQCTGI